MAIDFVLVGAITFFVLLISSLLYYSHRQSKARSGLTPGASFLADPEALVRLQLDELLVSKGVKLPNDSGAFEYTWKAKEAYEAAMKLTASDANIAPANPAAAAGGSASSSSAASPPRPTQAQVEEALKSHQAKSLLNRAMELAFHMVSFDTRLAVVVESYDQQVPRELVGFLNSLSASLRAEATAVQEAANALKEGWGGVIMNQAMQLTVGLQQQKQARMIAEAKRVHEAANAEEAKADTLRNRDKETQAKLKAEEQAKEKAAKEAERAYKELMATEAAKKSGAGGGGSAKKDSAKKH